MKKKKKIKDIKLPIIPVLLSTLMFVYGTYAWFTYFSDVDSTMTGHVIGWNIDFDGKTNIENEYEIVVDKVVPGMEDYIREYTITNSGEAPAIITYDIKSVKIFDEIYVVGEEYDDVVLTNENLMELLETKYPFMFGIDISTDIIHTSEKSVFTFTLKWPFETYSKLTDNDTYDPNKEYFTFKEDKYTKIKVSESLFISLKDTLYILNDDLDTVWGEKAYDYLNDQPEEPCITFEIVINASQYLE